MIKNKREQVVGFVPYGGLGNQIFQFATALSLCGERGGQLAIDLIGKEKTNADGHPEIMDFEIEKITPIFIRNKSRSLLLKFFIEVQLRISSKVTRNRIINSLIKYLQILFSQVTSTLAGTKVLSPRGTGWDDQFKAVDKNFTLLGNFHSYMFIDIKVKRALRDNLKSRQNTELFEIYSTLATHEKPVAIHIRLGDYLDIDELNVVDKEYFLRAIEIMEDKNSDSNYWIFTNDESLSRSYLPVDIIKRCRFIPQSLNSAQTIEVMWLCDSYIISNSTFSWWGAFLSSCQSPLVIAPKKWFKNLEEPVNVCPPEWIRL
jgi:hypothetical protein